MLQHQSEQSRKEVTGQTMATHFDSEAVGMKDQVCGPKPEVGRSMS